MRLTAFTDFGLRALMRLAGSPERSFTVQEIAEEFVISRDHLMKAVRLLARHGFIATQRGAAGGIRLARSANEIRLGEVVRALEARHALVECFAKEGSACRLLPRCRLKRRLSAAREAFLDELDRSTLEDCAYPDSPKRRVA
jgi:Rrf2 family transcriptional regulator, nitric oxide-sensitive transcriptional repressor